MTSRIRKVLMLSAALAVTSSAPAAAQSRCGEHPWCDRSLPPEQRAELALDAMTLDEKVSLMAGDDPAGVLTGVPATGTLNGIPRLGLPTIRFNDGPAGIRRSDTFDGPTGYATALPAPLGLAASFDRALAERYGALIGDEATKRQVDVVLSPFIEIVRVPQWGRAFEVYGEDPYLTGRLAAAHIRGLQAAGPAANAKVYVGNNQDTNRLTYNAVIGERALREIYLPAQEAAARAGVGSFMLAYPRVNGSYMAENSALVDGVLRGDLGFDGLVLTDWFGRATTTRGAANGGADLEMPVGTYYSKAALKFAAASGLVSETTIDAHVRRLLRTVFRFGIPDRPEYPRGGDIDVAGHGRVARETAEEAIVLLKNAHGRLPLDAPRLRSVALIGQAAAEYHNGFGSSMVDPFYRVTVRDALERRAQGRLARRYDDGSDPARAARVAADAEAVNVAAADTPGEFADRSCLALECPAATSAQDRLIERVAQARPDAVVVLQNSGPVLMPWVDRVAAIVEAWYPGQEGGNAIANVLFGDVNPAGRLPVTFPRSEGDTPVAGHPERYPGDLLGDVHYSEGMLVGYRWYDEQGIGPLFPFGHGLSYTRFDYGRLRVRRAADGSATASVRVTNIGKRRGDEVAQLYVGFPAATGEPPRQLKAFERVRLAPSESRTVVFELDPRAFSHWDPAAHTWRIAPGCYSLMVGASSRDIRETAAIGQGAARC
jgi:beta-glucosidase